MTRPADTSWAFAADRLAAILEAENAALEAHDFPAAAALLAQKQAAIAAIAPPPPGIAEPALREAAARLDRLAAKNRGLLNRSLSIQSQVLGIIAGAARAASVQGYGSSGKSAIRGGAFTLSAKA